MDRASPTRSEGSSAMRGAAAAAAAAASRASSFLLFPPLPSSPSSFLSNRGHGGRKNKLSSCPSRSPLVGSWHLFSLHHYHHHHHHNRLPPHPHAELERVAISRFASSVKSACQKARRREGALSTPSLLIRPAFLDLHGLTDGARRGSRKGTEKWIGTKSPRRMEKS